MLGHEDNEEKVEKLNIGERSTLLLQKQHNGIGKLAWQPARCHGNHMTAHWVGKQGCWLPRVTAVLHG